MPLYGGTSGTQSSKNALLVDYGDDEDLYEGFNYSIDLAPPQTASNSYQPSSYGRGGFNQPPGTAFRYVLCVPNLVILILLFLEHHLLKWVDKHLLLEWVQLPNPMILLVQ